ncbi:MAG: peptide deformylase [Alphaproteobacteria bacterium]|nr:MAG: peptide deformylase [Alphaproteobacteria bacterium]
MARAFLLWPDPRLKTAAAPVAAVDEAVRALWAEMLEAMYAMPGIGLAAPQIGEMLRLAVIDCSPGRDAPIRMANPELVSASVETARGSEASPNLPGIGAEVERPVAATLRWLDDAGQTVERELRGLWARSALHQLDHLDGRLYIDRLSPLRRRMVVEKYRKARRRR